MPKQVKTHNVYVIGLDTAVAREKTFRDQNPNYKQGQACLYVGMTGTSPEERFNQHKVGYKASRAAKKYGLCLRPKLFDSFNPMTYAEAVEMEVELARQLRAKGYGVWQN